MRYALIGLMALFLAACQSGTNEAGSTGDVSLDSNMDTLCYSYGVTVGQNIKSLGDDLNREALMAGILEGIEGREPKVDNAVLMTKAGEFLQMVNERAVARNQAEGQAFLQEKAEEEGVVVLPSGLQYKVIREGDGASPTASDRVTIHYRGTLIDGTQFDSSFDRGEPITYPVNGFIPGWVEGLQLMQEGAKYEFYIPSDLAYGNRGNRGIPPNSTLVFEVELIKVN